MKRLYQRVKKFWYRPLTQSQVDDIFLIFTMSMIALTAIACISFFSYLYLSQQGRLKVNQYEEAIGRVHDEVIHTPEAIPQSTVTAPTTASTTDFPTDLDADLPPNPTIVILPPSTFKHQDLSNPFRYGPRETPPAGYYPPSVLPPGSDLLGNPPGKGMPNDYEEKKRNRIPVKPKDYLQEFEDKPEEFLKFPGFPTQKP